MITFGDARLVVQAHLDVTDPDHVTAADGFEDATHFLVPWGHRRWIEDGDPAFTFAGQATLFLDKATGEVEAGPEYLPGTPTGDRVDRMTPVRDD